jgi:hypothetical protein
VGSTLALLHDSTETQKLGREFVLAASFNRISLPLSLIASNPLLSLPPRIQQPSAVSVKDVTSASAPAVAPVPAVSELDMSKVILIS